MRHLINFVFVFALCLLMVGCVKDPVKSDNLVAGYSQQVAYPNYKVAVLNLTRKSYKKGYNYLWEAKPCYNAGSIIGNKIEQNIIESNIFPIIDRNNINKILSEHKLNASGLTSENAEAIRLLNADGIIIGEIHGLYTKKQLVDIGGVCNFTVKLVDVKSGKVLFVFSAEEETFYGDYKTALKNALEKFKNMISQYQLELDAVNPS